MSFSPVIKQVITQGILGSAKAKVRYNTAGIALFGLAGSVGFLGLVFLAIAWNNYLLSAYSAPVAAAVTGGSVLLLALVISGCGYWILRRRKSAGNLIPAKEKEVEDMIDLVLDSMLSELEEPIRQNPKTAMAIAGLAGLVAGDRLH